MRKKRSAKYKNTNVSLLNALKIKKNLKKFVIKPTDSSGAKGVFTISSLKDLHAKYAISLSFSKNKEVIIEEFLPRDEIQIGGDGFSVNGRLAFHSFSQETFSKICMAPINNMFPLTSRYKKQVIDDINRLFALLKLGNGAYNFDILISNKKVYIIEIGARCGGDYIPQISYMQTGISLVDLVIKAALKQKFVQDDFKYSAFRPVIAGYHLHSNKDGIFKNIVFSKKLQIIELNLYVKDKDEIKSIKNSSNYIGVIIMRFKNIAQMRYVINHFYDFYKIEFY